MPWEITHTETRAKKICFDSDEELWEEINSLGAYKIHSVRTCTPDATNTKHWMQVFYEVSV